MGVLHLVNNLPMLFKELQDEEIVLPVNICSQHEQYFEQCLKWQYYNPEVKGHYF